MFKKWLILIEMTTAQFLKRSENKEYAARVGGMVGGFLSGQIHNAVLLPRYTGWFLKELVRQGVPAANAPEALQQMWQNIGAYFAGTMNNNQIQSRINTYEYDYNAAIADSDEWHDKLRRSTRKKPAEGRVVVELSDLTGFEGWSWVALDRASCGQEGDAMGHCGNAGSHAGDNILSLRDPEGNAHLTFINNKGSLGEMKGRGNSKPPPKYYPAIVKLLLSNEIGTVNGGGYAPQNNFSLADLPPDTLKMIKSRKPYIDNPDKFNCWKVRHSLISGKRTRGEMLRKSNPDDIGTVTSDIVTRNYSTPKMYDDDGSDDMPDKVYRQNIWKMYGEFLDAVYARAKRMHPDQLFSWMDQLIATFVREMVVKDDEIWQQQPDNPAYAYASNLIRLRDMVQRLMEGQPEVLMSGPSRSKFSSYSDYMKSLSAYLDRQGYDLPPYRPSNHQISYEFNRKMMEEIENQGREVLRRADDVLARDPLHRRLAAMRRNRWNP